MNTLERRLCDPRLYLTTGIVFPLIVVAGFARTYYLRSLFGTPPLPSWVNHTCITNSATHDVISSPCACTTLGPLWFFGLPTLLALLCLTLATWRNRQVNSIFLAGALLLIASYVVRLAVMGTGTWMHIAVWLTSLV